ALLRKAEVGAAVVGDAAHLVRRIQHRGPADVVDGGNDRDVLLDVDAEPDLLALARQGFAYLVRIAFLVRIAVGIRFARTWRRFAFFALRFLARFARARLAREPLAALAVALARGAPTLAL